MTDWKEQFDALIGPAIARSKATDYLLIDRGALAEVGRIASQVTRSRRAAVFADQAGFVAAGARVSQALEAAGFAVETLVLPDDPLPKASVDEAQPILECLAADEALFPVSVGSGVMNDLVKYAAFQTGRRYMSVATAASMDGYTSAGAPLAKGGFKVTIPTRAPIALVADMDVIATAPAEMTGWGYGDLAGKSPAGGDWLLAELVGAEPRDDTAWPLVQDHLRGWLADPAQVAGGDFNACARLFIGLTAVGFAMEFHESSRPASGADHQIAHMWEMEGLAFAGRKVSHGAAVSVGCVLTLAFYDWLLAQDLSDVSAPAPDLEAQLQDLRRVIPNDLIADRAEAETRAKTIGPDQHAARLSRIRAGWSETRTHLQRHLYRADEMMQMLEQAGAPARAVQIGVDDAHLERTLRAAAYIRSRYTILDFLKETGLFEPALQAVMARLGQRRIQGAAE